MSKRDTESTNTPKAKALWRIKVYDDNDHKQEIKTDDKEEIKTDDKEEFKTDDKEEIRAYDDEEPHGGAKNRSYGKQVPWPLLHPGGPSLGGFHIP